MPEGDPVRQVEALGQGHRFDRPPGAAIGQRDDLTPSGDGGISVPPDRRPVPAAPPGRRENVGRETGRQGDRRSAVRCTRRTRQHREDATPNSPTPTRARTRTIPSAPPLARDVTGSAGRAEARPRGRPEACRRNPARAMKVQMRGGARWPHARRTLCTLSVRRGRRPADGPLSAALAFPAVVGSIIVRISETRLAGKPPCFACSRTIASFGAM